MNEFPLSTSRRLMPLFLLRQGRLVKGVGFQNYRDVGDPLSQSLIYDAQGAEEIVLADIDATSENRLIDLKLVSKIAARCRLPISVGGGIGSREQALRCFEAGADKIVINSAAVEKPGLVGELAREFGAQSVLVSLDVRQSLDAPDRWDVYTHAGQQRSSHALQDVLMRVQNDGAGEIMLTSIDREGTLSGFDADLYRWARPLVQTSLIASGGAGHYWHVTQVLAEQGCDAAALGTMLFLRDYDIVRIKSFLMGQKVPVRDS